MSSKQGDTSHMNTKQRVHDLKAKGLTIRKIAKELGLSPGSVARHYKSAPRPHSKLKTEYHKDRAEVEVVTAVRTLDDALAKADVDTDVWEVERWVCNAYEQAAKDDTGTVNVTPLWQIKVWLVRKSPTVSALDRLIDTIGDHPERPRRKAARSKSKGCLLNLSIPDLHVGKRPMSGVYPVESIYEHCIDTILERVDSFDISLIHLPIGSDLLNVDNSHETTTRGTPQNQSESFEDAATRAVNLLIHTINRLSELAPVKVTAVRGNHDRDSTYWVGQILAAWYRDDKRVNVEAPGPGKRVYLRFGQTLILTYHGDCVKPDHIESLMIRERPADFAECTFREAHAGHLHKSAKKRLFSQDTIGSVVWRQLPSLSPTDQWHHDMGYVGSPRFAEAQVFDHDEGCVCTVEARPPSTMYE